MQQVKRFGQQGNVIRPGSDVSGEASRGRAAAKPGQIPKKGWKDILLRTKKEMNDDNIDLVAAGVAFYALLSVPFILTAIVSIYGMIADPAEVQSHLNSLSGFLPADAMKIISAQLNDLTKGSSGALSLALIGSILFALWSGSKGTKSLITALNITYDENEKRGFVKLTATAVFLTLASVIGAIVAISVVVGLPAMLKLLSLPPSLEIIGTIGSYLALGALFLVGLAVLYRYAPSREKPKWRWVSPGAAIAMLLWVIGSVLFSWYVTSMGKYNETYGALGGVVVTLMWFYLSAYCILLGSELNSEMEHQTAKDTTHGPAAPMGERGARMADTIGEKQAS